MDLNDQISNLKLKLILNDKNERSRSLEINLRNGISVNKKIKRKMSTEIKPNYSIENLDQIYFK